MKKVKLVMLITALMINGVALADLNTGLVAYYCFDDAANIGKDCSTNGNNGSPIGQVNSVTGLKGNAANFGGYNNPASIHVPNSPSLQFSNDATFSFAVKMTGFDGMDGWGSYSASGAHSVIAKSHDRTGISLLVGGDVATGNFGTWIGTYKWADANKVGGNISTYKADTWNRVVYIFSNSTHTSKLFINGVLIKSIDTFDESFDNLNSQDLYLGKFSDSWFPLNGSLDDVRIYNRALTDNEVATLAGITKTPFEKYDIAIYGDATEDFWKHNYHVENNISMTHTGKDFQIGKNEAHVSIYSYGFGKVLNIEPKYNALTIRHLLNNGEYVNVNLLHLHSVDRNVSRNNYVTKYQLIGKEGNKGLVGFIGRDAGTHLHFEVAKEVSLAWVATSKACPGKGCVDDKGRTTDFDLGDLTAHYEITSTKKVSTPYKGRVWYDPDVFATHTEAIPYMSMSSTAPYAYDYDVYGIADKPIHGFLDLMGCFQQSTILVRDFFKRADSENTGNPPEENQLLGNNGESCIDGISASHTYPAGDYLFLAYVKNKDESRYGYPVKFSFIEENDLIIDNDQKNADTDASNDSKNEPTYNGSSNMGSKVPGYFLTADLHAGRSDAFAQWRPYKTGNYKIYVHIPEYGASATNVTYVIKKDGTDLTAVNSSPINQSTYSDQWVQVIASDGTDTFQFNESGYLGLSLSKNKTAINYPITEKTKVAFDAVKFDFVR